MRPQALDSEQRWRTHTERVLTATMAELAQLPAMLAAARWQPQWAYRKAMKWREAQHVALVGMAETRVHLSETLAAIRAHAAAERGALSVRLLAELQPELMQLVSCAQCFAAEVAGRERPETSRLARACEAAVE